MAASGEDSPEQNNPAQQQGAKPSSKINKPLDGNHISDMNVEGAHDAGSGQGAGKVHYHDISTDQGKDHVAKPNQHADQPPDSDGLNNPWEQQGNIDGNEEGQLDGGSPAAASDGSGGAEIGGNDQEIADSGSPLHELDHNTSLRHGGAKSTDKPRRPPVVLIIVVILFLVGLVSVMAYLYQLGNNAPTGDGSTPESTESVQNDSQPIDVPTDVPTNTTQGDEATPTSSTQGGNQASTTGGGGGQPTVVVTLALAQCAAGWLPASGCFCCGTTLTCADGTVAQFNPQCGVGGTKCTCDCPVGNPNCYDSCTGAICVP